MQARMFIGAKKGFYKKIREKFDQGFSGDWRECVGMCANDLEEGITRANWYTIATQLKKYYQRRHVNFGTVPLKVDNQYVPNSLRVYKVITDPEDLQQAISHDLDRTHRVSIVNFDATEVALNNVPQLLADIAGKIADLNDTYNKLLRTLGGLKTKQMEGGQNGNSKS